MKKIIIVIFASILLASIQAQTIDLTSDEIQWIKNHPVVKLAPDPAYGPIEFFNDSGEYEGLSADYIKLIEDITGVHFEIVHLENWSEIIEQAEAKTIDFIGAATISEQRSEYLIFSDYYITIPGVIITRSNFRDNISLDDLKDKHVVVMKGYAIIDFLAINYPDIILEEVTDLKDGLQKVSFGTFDYLITDVAQTTFVFKENIITNLKISSYINERDSNLGFAMRNDWPELQGIINKALIAIPESTKKEIYYNWIQLKVEPLISRNTIYIFVASLLIILFFLFFISMWNRTLKHKVDQQTKSLSTELEERTLIEKKLETLNRTLEERVENRTIELTQAIIELKEVQSKLIESEKMASLSSLLISISHKLNTPIGNCITLVSYSSKSIDTLIDSSFSGTLSKSTFNYELNTLHDSLESALTNLLNASNSIEQFKKLVGSNSYNDYRKTNLQTFIKSHIQTLNSELTSSNTKINLICPESIEPTISITILENIFKNLISNSIYHGFSDGRKGIIDIQVSEFDDTVTILYKDNGVGIEDSTLKRIYEPLFTTNMGMSDGFGLNIIYNGVVNIFNGSITVSSEKNKGTIFEIKFPNRRY